MRTILVAIIIACFPLSVLCQDITGLWTGTIKNDSTQETLKYEIFISKTRNKFSGYSQTWFVVNNKTYYGIKKLNIRIAKDGKIVMQDGTLLENNYPQLPAKNVIQLNVLNLLSQQNETMLDGIFVTNSSKSYVGLTGHVSMKKTESYRESSLMQFLNKANGENDVTVLK